MCRNFKFVDQSTQRRRLPAGILTCLLKKYWPGLYKSGLEEKKLALKWEDYEAAKSGGTMTDDDGVTFVPNHAQVVHNKFWVSHSLLTSDLCLQVTCTLIFPR